MADGIDNQARLATDLSNQWAALRTVVEDYADRYYLQARPKRATAQEWMKDGVDVASRLSMIWMKGIAIVAKEGARMATEAAKERAKELNE